MTAAEESPPPALCLGPYHLEGREGLLWRHDHVVALSPKAVAVLWRLISRAGRLVSKAELFAAAWPETAVTEGVLAVRIRELRRALGDETQWPRYIETVHRRGCRFIAPVTTAPQVGGTRQVSRQPPALPRSTLSPVASVGREAELAHLARCDEEARRGQRQVLFVTGDAGTGKTTLVDAFTAQLGADEPVWIGRGQCVEQYGAGEAYLPLLEALSQLGRGPAAGVIVAHLRQFAPSRLGQLPAVVRAEDRAAMQHQVQGMTPQRILRELAEALEALTAAQPVVLVLEDLHWSDVSTVEALALLARRREAARLLVIGTYRPVELILRAHPLKAVKQELQLHGQCSEVPLGCLSPAEVQAYLTQRVSAPAAALAAVVYRRTEGFPLFMVHVLDYLEERGLLTDAAAAEDARHMAQAAAEVPVGLWPLIELQLERLSAEQQQVLEVASVVGVEFAAAGVAAGLPAAVGTAAGQFIEDLGLAEWPDGTVSGRYGYRHAL